MRKVHPRVAAGGVGGSLSVLLVALLGYYGVDVTPDVASAMTVVISFVASVAKADA